MATTEPKELTPAEVEKYAAEAEAFRQEAALHAAETRKVTAQAIQAEIALEREQEKRRKELTANEHHYRYVFDTDVSEASAKACINQLTAWERMAEGPITVDLVIDSPGGSVFAGFKLIDFIRDLHKRFHTVNTTTLGMAASMGGVLLQVGKKRTIGRHAMLLIHEAQFGAVGSFGKVEDQVKLVEQMHEHILEIFAERSNLTKAQIKRRWRRTDWWLPAQQALEYGFVDEVA